MYHEGRRPPRDTLAGGGVCQGWQHHGSRASSTRFHDTELLPALAPPAQALLRSQSGPRAAAWLGTVPSEAGTTIPPHHMLIALRLRLPLPVAQGRREAHGPGCGAAVDVYGDHFAACPRTGLLARRAKPLEIVRACVDTGCSRSTRARGPGRSATVARSDACPGCRSG